jgi:hypothetical protein
MLLERGKDHPGLPRPDEQGTDAAVRYTALTAPAKFDNSQHDVGFMLGSGYGNGCRLTGDPACRDALLAGATTLITRYNPQVGAAVMECRRPQRLDLSGHHRQHDEPRVADRGYADGSVSVVGFDNIRYGRYTTPALTTVDPQSERLGATLIKKLAKGVVTGAQACARAGGWRDTGDTGDTSTRSMRLLSMSTTSKRRPSQSK